MVKGLDLSSFMLFAALYKYLIHPIDSLYTVKSVKDTVPVIELICFAKDAR